jgi:ATP-binding cassette subfamily C protein LapB
MINESNLGLQIQDEQNESSDGLDKENSLLLVLQKFIALHGMAFSQGALRDLSDGSEKQFNEKSALQVLTALGFEASFGRLKVKRIKNQYCPMIAFKKDGAAVLIDEVGQDGHVSIKSFDEVDQPGSVSKKELGEMIQDYFIIASKPSNLKQGRFKNNWFWGSFSQSKWLYFQVIVAAALTNFLGLSTSVFIMVVYDRVVPNEAIESLIVLTVGVCVALIFDFIIKSLRAQFVDRAGKRADMRMSRLIFDKLLSSEIDGKSRKTGAMAAVVREFDTLREFFTSATLVAIVDLPFVFFFIWIISLIAGPLALVPLIAVPIVIFVGLIIQPFLAALAEGSLNTNMSKQGVLVETLNGLETIKSTGSGRLMRRRFEEATTAQSDMGLKSRMLSQFAINTAASVQQFAQIATIFFGVFLIQNGQVSMGALIAAVILGGRTLAPLSQLAAAMSRANGARQAFRSLSELMQDQSADGDRAPARLSRSNFQGSIELLKMGYKFRGSQAHLLKDISLKIPAGQKVAVLGKMGSGKSTLAKLLSGVINPTEGAVMIDGIDLRQIDPFDFRRNVGVMPQETWLFSGSVKENLQLGYFEYSDDHILEIAKISGVDDFISKHPSGYDLDLKERGEGLSGGQRQSISLARAMLHDPSVIILDEPTSSMDQGTEASVLRGLKEWGAERTMVVITHRNSILDLVDRVLVMDEGAIVMDTTPQKLRQQK